MADRALTRIADRLEEIAQVGDVNLDDGGPGLLALAAQLHDLAAASPRPVAPRDESVPPPGWTLSSERFDDEDEPWVERPYGCAPLSEAWKRYDAERAPPRAASPEGPGGDE